MTSATPTGAEAMKEAERLTALLERLRERCAETAENAIAADYGDKAAARIRAIELDVAVRQFMEAQPSAVAGEAPATAAMLEAGERAFHAVAGRSAPIMYQGRTVEALNAAYKAMRAAAPSAVLPLKGEVPTGREDANAALHQISELLSVMLGSAQPEFEDARHVTGYRIRTGALHRALGVLSGAGHPVTVPLMKWRGALCHGTGYAHTCGDSRCTEGYCNAVESAKARAVTQATEGKTR